MKPDEIKRAKAVDAKLVWDYETMLVPAADHDRVVADLKHEIAALQSDFFNRVKYKQQARSATEQVAALTERLSWAHLCLVTVKHCKLCSACNELANDWLQREEST